MMRGTPLTIASHKGHSEVVNVLLKAGSKVNHQTIVSVYTCMCACIFLYALMYLARNSQYICTCYCLLSIVTQCEPLQYSTPFIQDKLTPLMLAAREGHTEVVRMLLSQSDLNTSIQSEVCTQTMAHMPYY